MLSPQMAQDYCHADEIVDCARYREPARSAGSGVQFGHDKKYGTQSLQQRASSLAEI
jgi:hypothetical protein